MGFFFFHSYVKFSNDELNSLKIKVSETSKLLAFPPRDNWNLLNKDLSAFQASTHI